MQQILFTDLDHYKNFKNLAIFALKCGVDVFQRPLPPLHLQGRRITNHQRRVSTNMNSFHLFLLEFVAEKKVYPILSIIEQANNFAKISRFSVINIKDDLINRLLQQIIRYMQNLRILRLSGCVLDDVTVQIITENCPLLVHLDLKSCTMIGNSSIYNIMRNCKELRCLGIDSRHITSMAVRDLIKELPYLIAFGIGVLMTDNKLTESIEQVGIFARYTLNCIHDVLKDEMIN